MNYKRVYRFDRKEGLARNGLGPKGPRSAMPKTPRQDTTRPNERWAMECVQDVLRDGRAVRVLNLVDARRERIALKAASRFRRPDVAAMLSTVIAERGRQHALQGD